LAAAGSTPTRRAIQAVARGMTRFVMRLLSVGRPRTFRQVVPKSAFTQKRRCSHGHAANEKSRPTERVFNRTGSGIGLVETKNDGPKWMLTRLTTP